MILKINEAELLERAKIEENNYNWDKSANLYEQVAESFLEKNLLEDAAKIYKKLGYVNAQASETADTSVDYIKLKSSAIIAYEKAGNLYKQLGNEPRELECEAETFYIKGILAKSIIEAKRYLNESDELFIKVSELFANIKDQKNFVRTLSRRAIILFNMIFYCDNPKEIEEICQKCISNADRSWKLSIEIGDVQSLAESLYAEAWASYLRPFIINFTQEEDWEEYFQYFQKKCDRSLEFVEGITNSKTLGEILLAAGAWYAHYGVFVKDKNMHREFIDKGIELIEKAIDFANKTKDKSLMIYSLYWIIWFSILGGRFKYIQKRILKDVQEIIKLGRIYDDLYSQPRFLANLLPANYYTYFAQQGFINPAQKKSYAEKGIEYANEALKATCHLSYYAWTYQILTSAYSQLVMLAISEDEKEEYIHNMLQHAKLAESVSEKYEGGYGKAAGYFSVYRAYKTLTDITINQDDKIKMLSITINALEKFIVHQMESRARLIGSQIRLGILYQKLGIISNDKSVLLKSKELFLRIINDIVKEGYYYYAAAAHEYIAQIEDRLGNHSVSAEHYEKALENHNKSLKNIEYPLLINKIKEKIDYSCAWNLIENAKAYHKKEEHLQAKRNYEEACKILETLQKNNYEAFYFVAWALQEEAEQYSKKEQHEEAIKKYEMTKKQFQSAKILLEETFKKSSDKELKERIKKLKKVADVRINYCSARIDVEKARILGKKGEHLIAAEKFAFAASQFKDVCMIFKIEKEREELSAVYYLCKAWESMELGENFKVPERFKAAANLFTKASQLFTESKLKFLASGNSSFCLALENGCKFDESPEIGIKAELYTQVKSLLRSAATSYEKGGFKSGADWALATSTYFDAVWHLIKADKELEIKNRKSILDISSNYLKSAAELFGKSGYKDKEKEVLEKFKRVKKEEQILISALNTIKKPSISGSIEGITAPACPLETSQPPRISEIQQFTEEEGQFLEKKQIKSVLHETKDVLKPKKKVKIPRRSVKEKKKLEKLESEIKVEDQKFICVVHKGQIVGTVYICPNCKTCYCLTCAYSLKANGEKCWTCNTEIKP